MQGESLDAEAAAEPAKAGDRGVRDHERAVAAADADRLVEVVRR